MAARKQPSASKDSQRSLFDKTGNETFDHAHMFAEFEFGSIGVAVDDGLGDFFVFADGRMYAFGK